MNARSEAQVNYSVTDGYPRATFFSGTGCRTYLRFAQSFQ